MKDAAKQPLARAAKNSVIALSMAAEIKVAAGMTAYPGTTTSMDGRTEDASRYCPVCSQRLESRRCKLICSVCGYYMSCSDYY